MAYLVDLSTVCSKCRTKPATVELKNRRNASHGAYCSTCGKAELKRLEREEREADGDGR